MFVSGELSRAKATGVANLEDIYLKHHETKQFCQINRNFFLQKPSHGAEDEFTSFLCETSEKFCKSVPSPIKGAPICRQVSFPLVRASPMALCLQPKFNASA